MSKTFSITTPIYYVNDVPHIGHAYTTSAADIAARHFRQKLGAEQVWFSTGVDEHAQKNVEAAAKQGKEVQPYVDELAKIWRRTFEELGIAFNDFIRTTEPRHRLAVEHFLKRIEASGDIYKGKYEGWYCIGHEAFMKASDLVNGKCPEHNRPAEWLVEENYFFRLSKYRDQLLEYFQTHPEFVVPDFRFNEVKQFVKKGLEDISISRQNQKWGIPLPGDPSHVIYVWIDALINYLTTIGYPDDRYKQWWPSVHVIGKDISKFHCIIWPAMLMSAGIALPKQVVINGFLTVHGQRMGKSLGNAVNPLNLTKKYGNDSLRYYLFREITFGADGDFSEARLHERYQADLANGLGNLVSRVTNMLEQYCGGQFTRTQILPSGVLGEYTKALENYRFHDALVAIWSLVDVANKKIDDAAPWKMAKEGKDDEVRALLNELANRVLDLNELLAPFLPGTSEKIAAAFKAPVKKAEPLFPRVV